MVQGKFIENIPIIQIVLAWGQSVQAPFVILDSGFTGDLQVTQKIAQELGLQVSGVTKTKIANGQVVEMPTALAVVSMEGATCNVQVMISESMPLAGIGLLTKFAFRAIINCKYRTVSLERVM